jgi:hypothetical protein
LRFWFVTLGCVLLGGIGIALEVARVISKDNGGTSRASYDPQRRSVDPPKGFYVPQKNVFSFASIQFLTVSVQHFSLSIADLIVR